MNQFWCFGWTSAMTPDVNVCDPSDEERKKQKHKALYPSSCSAQLPSPFYCFAACVDVYRTHANVHLRCFHTGKSTAIRAALSPQKLPVSPSAIIIRVICILILCLCWCGVTHHLAVWLQRNSCLFSTILAVLPKSVRSSVFWYQCVHAHCHSNLCLTDKLAFSDYFWETMCSCHTMLYSYDMILFMFLFLCSNAKSETMTRITF